MQAYIIIVRDGIKELDKKSQQ